MLNLLLPVYQGALIAVSLPVILYRITLVYLMANFDHLKTNKQKIILVVRNVLVKKRKHVFVII